MNILLIYPKYPETFWSFKHALKFISKKAVNPPLGLLTISSMLPENWNRKLIDMNVSVLKTKDIRWADMVFISAMNVQSESVMEVIGRCKANNKIIVGGGPIFTENYDQYPLVDHLVLNEAEITLPLFINDLNTNKPKRIYQTNKYTDFKDSYIPDYSLIDTSKYNTMCIQYSRGCPYNCEFCDITALFGHKVRLKSTQQVITELEAIYNTGWRKNVFFVDDNFAGNKKILKNELLPVIISWMEDKNYPFYFTTEVSINISDDKELLELLAKAGFSNIFIGIETPDEACLNECGKTQNKNRNMIQSIHRIQEAGIEVSGGFILGFDNDSTSIFQRQIDFIKESGIVSAMVGLLNAPRKTQLYKRLKSEGRIVHESSGNNTDMTLNFIPKMDKDLLITGYKKVIRDIYEGNAYYKRVLDFIKRFSPNEKAKKMFSFNHFIAFLKSIFRLGLIDTYRKDYWKVFLWTLFHRPKLVPMAITYSIYGYHFRKVFKNIL